MHLIDQLFAAVSLGTKMCMCDSLLYFFDNYVLLICRKCQLHLISAPIQYQELTMKAKMQIAKLLKKDDQQNSCINQPQGVPIEGNRRPTTRNANRG
jgi:hypothetical protein